MLVLRNNIYIFFLNSFESSFHYQSSRVKYTDIGILRSDYYFRIGYSCFTTHLVHTWNTYYTPGERLRNFEIIVHTRLGRKKRCGSMSTNKLNTGETKSFPCEPEAIGTAMTIILPGETNILTLCEVFIFGKGTVEMNVSIAINTGRKHTD